MRSIISGALCATVLLAASSASAFTVRTDRPRILLGGKGITPATYKARCTTDAAYQKRCAGGLGLGAGLWPAISLAAAYIVNGDATKCTAAYDRLRAFADVPGTPDPHTFISNNGRTMVQLAITSDWCDPALSDDQKKELEDKMVLWADWYVANEPGDVFHDDETNVWNSIALAGLALKGTAQDTKASDYLTKADARWKTVILPAMAHVGDWWHEGMTYVQPTIGALAWYGAAWSTATDDDIHAWAKTNAKDLFDGYLRFHAYALRPDDKYVYFGDTADAKQSVELFSRWLVDMLNYGVGSPLGQRMSMEIRDRSRPYYDYNGADGYMIALLYDASKEASATPLASFEKAQWLSKGANDIAVLRSGWGKDDTYVWLSCGDYLGAHQHDESGALQIHRHSLLTGSTGYYDSFDTDHWANYYSQHSVHANTLAIYQPGEIFPTSKTLTGGPNVNDGGQRTLRRNKDGTGFPSKDLATYLANKSAGPHYETGDLKTFEHGTCHDYVACDITAAYDSPAHVTNGNKPKVNEVTRQVVFFPPELIVVFDRIESTDPTYDKRFLMHSIGTPPDIKGNVFTLTNGTGRLIGQTLLPADADMNVVTNFSVEGTTHAPWSTGDESGGTRLEISPKKESARDYFLHVLDATDPSTTTAPTAKVVEDATSATVTIDHAGSKYSLKLAKTGAMGGHVTVTGSDGKIACDQDLGAKGTGPLPDGGIPADDASLGDSGGADSGPPGATPSDSESSGGCGCRFGSREESGLAVLGLVAGFGLLLRRRSRVG